MAAAARTACMRNASSDAVTPTFKESLSITDQEGGYVTGTNVNIKGQGRY